MPRVTAYHRPASLDEALDLLGADGRIPMGGGTLVNTPGGEPVEVVDLQALGLSGIAADGDEIRLGAMTVLSDLADADTVPAIVAEAARRELPSTLRGLATVGGTVAVGDPESVLLAALLAHGGRVEVDGSQTVPLAEYLEDRSGLITAVTIEAGGSASIAGTGRTPADVPIVAAVARRHDDAVTVVLTGVANVPVVVDPNDPIAGLAPAGDFRGTSEYRLHLASVNTQRALADLG